MSPDQAQCEAAEARRPQECRLREYRPARPEPALSGAVR